MKELVQEIKSIEELQAVEKGKKKIDIHTEYIYTYGQM